MALDYIHDATKEYFAATWILNAIANNQNRFVQDLSKIPSFPNTERMIICGTGPSLNSDFLNFHLQGDNVITVANHSNLSTLLYEGIVPELVVIADSGDTTYHRIKRDVLPNFKQALKKNHTCFILPSHAHPKLVELLTDNHIPVYIYNAAIREFEGDTFAVFYNKLLYGIYGATKDLQTFVLQSGSVSNASVLIAYALQKQGSLPKIEEVILSGVDYSYPNYYSRCEQVVYNAEIRDFEVEKYPTYIPKELIQVLCNGMPTSEDQLAYYRDLRYIYENMVKAATDAERPFLLFTSQHNFISDFLPIHALVDGIGKGRGEK